MDPPNLQILEPPGSCRLQDFLILAAGFASLEGPKSGNNWMLKKNSLRFRPPQIDQFVPTFKIVIFWGKNMGHKTLGAPSYLGPN